MRVDRAAEPQMAWPRAGPTEAPRARPDAFRGER